MTDTKLLKLAAKAVGIPPHRLIEDEYYPHAWNPLEDDGDALRLAVKLQIDIKQYKQYVIAWYDGGYTGTGEIPYAGDPYKATRRAITRAAAEVGKDMK